MVISARQRQKKLERNNKKKALAKKSLRGALQLKGRASAYAEFPVHECLLPDNLFEIGMGNILVARRTPDGMFAVSVFLLDVFCLGVKDAFFYTANEHDYEHRLRSPMMAAHEGSFGKAHVACIKKLIDGGIGYAKALGFSPHPDYQKARGLIDNVDGGACPVKYEYGKDGKPFYIRGPSESLARARKIAGQLERKCGQGNYEVLVPMDMNEGIF